MNRCVRRASFGVAVLVLGIARGVAGQCESAVLAPMVAAPGDWFGEVAIWGDTIAVGAPFDDGPEGFNAGSVTVFRLEAGAWVATQTLLPAAGEGNAWFGFDVDLEGEHLVVGEGQWQTVTPVHVYRRIGDEWVAGQALLPADAATGFGTAVAISGNWLVVGANTDGAAYVYRFDGQEWVQYQKLLAWDFANPGLGFGGAVAIDGGRIVVGRSGGGGAAYIFGLEGSTWLRDTLLPGDPDLVNPDFGSSVAVSGDTVMVGDPHSGTVSVFRLDGGTWSLAQTITGEVVGREIAISGGTAVVFEAGAPARVFTDMGGEWVQTFALAAAGMASNDLFGDSLAIHGDLVVAGAPLRDAFGEDSGAAYVLPLTGPDGDADGVFDPCDNCISISNATQSDCDGDGAGDACDDPDLDLDGVPDNCDNCPAIANGGQADCDGDGVGDACAIAAGTSRDCDADGVPDECAFPAVLSASDAEFQEGYGAAVALGGETMVVTALLDLDENFTVVGSAHVYRFDETSWTEVAKVGPAAGQHEIDYGYAAAADGNRVLVGARLADSPLPAAGAATIYEFDFETGDYSERLLTASDQTTADLFGAAAALRGDVALIGAPQAGSEQAPESGAAYVFRFDAPRRAWVEEAKLIPWDFAGKDDEYLHFGWSVSIEGDRAAVGAPYGLDEHGRPTGAVYVFRHQGGAWLPEAKLLGAKADDLDNFGRAVALRGGDELLIGSPGVNGAVNDTGAVYVFRRDGGGNWHQEDQLFSALPQLFGAKLAVSGDLALVGSASANHGADFGAGPVDVLERDAASGAWSSRFVIDEANAGWSVAIDGDRAIVGAPLRTSVEYVSGSALLYDLVPRCLGDVDDDGVIDLGDLALLLDAWGGCPGAPAACPSDLDGDGATGMSDLLLLLANWS